MKGLLLFDIDGVIRNVAGSYRLAIQETVHHFSQWRPSIEIIDSLKSEGSWNNDWDASQELLKRRLQTTESSFELPSKKEIIEKFSNYYFGGNPSDQNKNWQGFINNEPLLVDKDFFTQLSLQGFLWGFVSGAEPPSAKFVLETRLGLKDPPLIAMGDAPEKPDPTGLIKLATRLAGGKLGLGVPPISYLGDTIADVLTIRKAREKLPNQKFISLAVAPPHLHSNEERSRRDEYEKRLKQAGAEIILKSTKELIKCTSSLVKSS